jgi:hypothetical protein
MRSMENNERRGGCVPRLTSGVELTVHGVALFSRERIEPRVDSLLYNGYN